jgi:hypothetical protein
VDLLREAARRRFTWDRLRRWLLLAARTLLLLFLILFAARPVYRGAGGTGSGLAGVILLDASWSLQASLAGGSGFDRARDLARGLLEDRRPGERWGVVVFSDRVEASAPISGDPGPARATLEAARATFRGTDVGAGLAEAEKLLAGERSAVVALFSDMARHGWGNVAPRDRPPLTAVEVLPERGNAGIAGLRFNNGRAEALIRRWNLEGAPAWGLHGKERLESRGAVRWAGNEGRAEGRLPPGEPGEFRLDPDALAVDNHWYFVPPAAGRFSVLVVNGAPSLSPVGDETYFVGPVLDAWAEEGLRLGAVSPGELGTVSLAGWEAVALFNPPPLSREAVSRLRDHVEAGGGLWVTAGDRGGAASLGDLLPVAVTRMEALDEPLRVNKGFAEFPGLEGFAWEQVRVGRAVAGEPRPGSRTLLSGKRSGRPLLVLGELGKGRTVFWASSIDRDWTNLPAKPVYPVLARALLNHAARQDPAAEASSFFVGDILVCEGSAGPWEVLRPDGRLDRLPGAESFRYDRTDRPGFYQVRPARGASWTMAVNVDSRANEGDLVRLTPAEARERLGPDVPLRCVPAERAGLSALRATLRGRDLAPWAGRLALFFFVLETVFLWPRKKR